MVDSRPCSTCKRILPVEQLMPRSNGWFCGTCDEPEVFHRRPRAATSQEADEG